MKGTADIPGYISNTQETYQWQAHRIKGRSCVQYRGSVENTVPKNAEAATPAE
jgi:hypothetical protein